MTINVALVTSEALVLGCDSTASTSDTYIDPFALGMEVGQDGKFKQDDDGRFTVKFKFDNVTQVVTDAWGSVTKMFPLCSQDCHAAGVTSGLASLNGRTMSSLATDFHATHKPRRPNSKKERMTVKAIAEGFLKFLRTEYDEQYKDSPLPEFVRDGPELLIGGFAATDKFPSCYRIRVKENDVKEEFANGASGLSWNAQSDAVERVIRGFDSKALGARGLL
jgi:hypothetical protein